MMSQHHPDRTGPSGSPHDEDRASSLKSKAVDRSSEIHLSIIVPVFGSESTLRELCQRIATAVHPLASQFENILIDDSSTDSSWALIQELCAADERIVGARLSTNMGQQRATLLGIGLARGRTVVTLDDDLQQYPEDIPLLCQALEDREFDAAIGSFTLRHQAWYRNLGSAVALRIAKRLLGIPQSLQLTSFRAMSSEVADEVLRRQGPNSAVGPLVLRATGAVTNVGVRHASRRSGSSGFTASKLLDLFFSTIFDPHPHAYRAGRWLGSFMLLLAGVLSLSPFQSSGFSFLRVLLIVPGLLLVSLEAIRKRVAPAWPSEHSSITMEILRGHERSVVDVRPWSQDA